MYLCNKFIKNPNATEKTADNIFRAINKGDIYGRLQSI